MEAPSPLTPLTDEGGDWVSLASSLSRGKSWRRGAWIRSMPFSYWPRGTDREAASRRHPIGAPSRAWAATISGHAPDWLRAAVASTQSVADFGAHRADLRADQLEGADNEDRDQRCDQRILDRGGARVVMGKILHRLEHWVAPNSDQRPTRFPAVRLNPTYPYPLSFTLIRFITNDASENSVNDPFATDLNPRVLRQGDINIIGGSGRIEPPAIRGHELFCRSYQPASTKRTPQIANLSAWC